MSLARCAPLLGLLLLSGCPHKPAVQRRQPSRHAARPAAKPRSSSAPAPRSVEQRRQRLVPRITASSDALAQHHAALVLDAHSDVALRITDEAGFDYGKRSSRGHTDLVRMKEGGLDAEFLAVWVAPRHHGGARAWRRAMTIFDAIDGMIKKNQQRARLALTVADVRATVASGKIALLLGVEGAHAIGRFDDEQLVLSRVRRLHQRGARYLTLTWMTSNPLAGASGDGGRRRGLSPLGRKVVSLMNELGMMVDVSHASDRTFHDVLKTSRLPVLASHSGARALASHHRNLSDPMLRALARNQGAVCINFFAGFLSDRWMRQRRKLGRKRIAQIKPVPLSVLVDHIDHVVKIAGHRHVCLGSDFDGVPSLPAGLDDASRMPLITAELLRRNYTPTQIRNILGENVLRVMQANHPKEGKNKKGTE